MIIEEGKRRNRRLVKRRRRRRNIKEREERKERRVQVISTIWRTLLLWTACDKFLIASEKVFSTKDTKRN